MFSPEQIENIRKQLGVDQPYYVQLWIFIKQILTFDYGASWSTGEPVSQIILTRLGPSLTLLIPLDDFTNRDFNYPCFSGCFSSWIIDRSYGDDAVHHWHVDQYLVYIIIFQYVLAYQLSWFPCTRLERQFSRKPIPIFFATYP